MGRYSLDTFDMGMGKPLPRERWPLTLLELLWLSAVAGFAYEPWGPLGVVAASCFFVHYFFDGAWRWQLYVLYGATVAVLPSLWFSNLLEDYRVEAQSIAVAAVCLTLVFAVAVPRVTLPGPTGPCRDITRHSCVVDSPTDGVVFTLTAYVPTKLDLRDASPAAYLRKGTAATAGMALLAKIPAQLLTTVAATGSRLFTEDWALPDPRAFFLTRPADTPKASESKLPVVVFSHGLGGVPDVYQSIISEVCSHGFIVLAVEHNDGSAGLSALPARFGNPRPYEPLTAEQAADPRLSYVVRRDQLHVRVREVLTAVDFVEALALPDADPTAGGGVRRGGASGGASSRKGASAKDRRRAKEAASSSRPSRESLKARAGRALPAAKSSARKAAAPTAGMVRPQDIKPVEALEIGADATPVPPASKAPASSSVPARAAAHAATDLVAAAGRGAGSGKGAAAKRSPYGRSVVRLRRAAREQGEEAARLRRSGGGQDSTSAADRAMAAQKLNEDTALEMMAHTLADVADPSRISLMGHSFGGATVLQAASARPGAFTGVVALDPWLFPLHCDTITRGLDPSVPVLVLSCPRFAAPWNSQALSILLDPASRAAAAAAFESGADPSAAPPVIEGHSERPHPMPTQDECNGIDLFSGLPLVPIQGADAKPDAPRLDRCLAVLPGSEHQSFADMELIAEPLLRLTGAAGTAPAEASQALIRRVVSRWLIARSSGRVPAAGPTAPSDEAMAPGAPAFKHATASLAGLPPNAAGDTSGGIPRGLRAFGVGGCPWQWESELKKARCPVAGAAPAADSASDSGSSDAQSEGTPAGFPGQSPTDEEEAEVGME
ncbi:hypothetical protein FNF27_00698 [Cafeteria roenbergensis]|uniref:1-alkyl-2-acetylglycerophosphocholine esterase n=2 Tax=Cafeteria roenbergensis TaxID=33653 RepID=A0A5A8EK20_CAFRO|nr:hypothetical protein FNF27_00698 [Cafeteria roenbergensis]